MKLLPYNLNILPQTLCKYILITIFFLQLNRLSYAAEEIRINFISEKCNPVEISTCINSTVYASGDRLKISLSTERDNELSTSDTFTADMYLLLEYQNNLFFINELGEFLQFNTLTDSISPKFKYKTFNNEPFRTIPLLELALPEIKASFNSTFYAVLLKPNHSLNSESMISNIANQTIQFIDNSNTNQSNFEVTVYDPAKSYYGSTFFSDGYNNRLVEVDMNGVVIWEYVIPKEYIKGPLVGFEGEVLSNGNILISISNSGIYEIDRTGYLCWSHIDPKVSHDADRMENGNTIYVFGNNDITDDANIKIVSKEGKLDWSWRSSDYYKLRFPYSVYANQGYCHINGVQQLSNGNIMVSLRNFFLTTILDTKGNIVREYDWSLYGLNTDPHDPVMYEDENSLLVCLQNDAQFIAVEIDASTENIIWSYSDRNIRTTRDCNKLPNGNYLITAVDKGGTENSVSMDDDTSVIFEVTKKGEIVWQLNYKNNPVGSKPGWFFKAERLRK